ncbi:MAG TPA: UDP-glucose 4-epimerase GalE [Smithellaceae bacterium]|nr:UDP-glucose 4-epimerase GalE [Smithellaceae bacterium]HRS89409.1 UDP-glucose 4-epimerase GalE [Smithellaceae bacterium]HRV26181.1 UDP-glucose 4-epimerase GalE [Smithellaceae bacterium]
MSILVTGGCGYIGSHACVELLNAGHDVIVLDNLSNSKSIVLERVAQITGKPVKFYEADILDVKALQKIFAENNIKAVIHFAGLKSAAESCSMPLRYYHNNVTGTIILCGVMKEFNVKKIVFSSSAAVYGIQKTMPISEACATGAANPYGRTKLIIEEILNDLYMADKEWSICSLRYFNAVGAHKSGKIGEAPRGIPNNLMPFIAGVAMGKYKELMIFGNDYDTADGTGVRDYIHVVDLAKGHIKALKKLLKSPGNNVYNLGTGRGYSVLEMVNAFETASGIKINKKIVGRREGDVAECYADVSKALKELGWRAEKSIDDMCLDTWRWQKQNPDGYQS